MKTKKDAQMFSGKQSWKSIDDGSHSVDFVAFLIYFCKKKDHTHG